MLPMGRKKILLCEYYLWIEEILLVCECCLSVRKILLSEYVYEARN
jgi:hypothetical protein